MALDPKERDLGPTRAALTALWRRDRPAFERLFVDEQRREMPLECAELTALAEAGLVFETEHGWRGLHQLRVVDGVGPRFYALGLGDECGEYRQDLWPETDALLAVIANAVDGGTFLDIGTGCGILAVEAALRGHRVTATDLYPRTLALAGWNARLNAADVELVEGDLWKPVAGRRFDLVVAATHYGHYFDQLRVEVTRGCLPHLSPGGRFVLACQLEWEGPTDVAGALGFESVLKPLDGAIRVEPILDARKRSWCSVPDPARRPLVARHRFTITVEQAPTTSLAITWPPLPHQRLVHIIPLSRLSQPRDSASIESTADLTALEAIFSSLRGVDCIVPAPFPAAVLDACRFGARVCVGQDGVVGAAGAIVDSDGGVRPCTHGERYADIGVVFADVAARLQSMRVDAESRRGCASCEAAAVCSRCLYPAVVDEAAYCDLIRRHRDALPVWARLLALFAGRPPSVPFRLRRWPRGSVAAQTDPDLRQIQDGWLAGQTFIVDVPGQDPLVVWLEQQRGVISLSLPAEVVALAVQIADGEVPADLDAASRYTLAAMFA